MPITANLVPAWPFPFNWENGITETLEWKTTILTSPSGAEQRYSARIGPRRKIEAPYLLHGPARSYFHTMLMTYGGGLWFVPLPWDAVDYALPVDTTSNAFYFDTQTRQFQAGAQIVLQGKHPWEWDVLHVANVTANGVTTTETPSMTYPNGCRISPAVLGQITDTVQASRATARVFSGNMQFEILEPYVWPPLNRVTLNVPSLAVGGLTAPVLTIEPNAAEALDFTYARTYRTMDNDIAFPLRTDPAKRAFSGQKYTWFLPGRQAGSDFRDFLLAASGQRMPLWVPTFNDDLTPGSAYYPNPGQRIQAPQPGLDTVMAFYADNTVGFYTVTPNPSNSYQLPQFESGSITRVSWLSLKRFAQDSVEILHQTDGDGLATVSISMVDAPDLRVATPYTAIPFPKSGMAPTSASETFTPVTNPTTYLTNPIIIGA